MFRPWRSAALPLAAIILVGAACSDDPSNAPPTNPPEDAASQGNDAPNASHQPDGPRTVAIIGDSISVGAQEELVATMPDDDVEVVATIGIRLGAQREAISLAVAARPDVLVIELGTNDVFNYTPEFLDEIDDVLDETDDLPCVRWVTVYAPDAEDTVEAINDHLDEAADDHDNLELIDWFTLVDDDPSLLSADGLHPNDTGQQVLADAVAASVERCTQN